ncbi:MAG: hypothetical protein J6A89_00655 [Clostridia bacterium]|nr:hypothetical protein [Clostridia bacterium]
MFFIGILTDKNSENNIKNVMKDKFNENELIFLNNENLENFRNVKFDSIIINEKVENEYILDKILKKSKYILWNSDIHCKSDKIKNICSNVITYGYNSKATVTISSATEENYMIFIQENIHGNNNLAGMQEIKFEKNKNNINAYDGMIITIMDLIYNTNNNM